MTIIFLSPFNGKIYVCPENQISKSFERDDPNLPNYIPNDTILYVKDGGILDKPQFLDYLEGNFQLPNTQQNYQEQDELDSGFRFRPKAMQNQHDHNNDIANAHRQYIHPKHSGTILITDIATKKYPDGIELNGKFHFMPIDEIGEDVLEESHQYRGLLAKGKIEIVGHQYYMQNRHKGRKKSPTDAALDAIIVKDQRRGAAAAVAESGGIGYENEPGSSNDPIEIYIE